MPLQQKTDPRHAEVNRDLRANFAPAMKHRFALVPDPSLEACADFTIGTGSIPFLSDHAFQDMVVLPGSFYIEMALSLHEEVFNRSAGTVRNITFQNPIIVTADDAVVRVEVRNTGADTFEYSFYELATAKAGPSRQSAARLEIDLSPSAPEFLDGSFSIELFQNEADEVIECNPFYQQLSDNGNQYGPRFRLVSSIWRAGNESLGKLSWPPTDTDPYCVRSTLLDSMTQMLAPFVMARGRTLVLRSIDRIEIAHFNYPDMLWCRATLRSLTEGESELVVGDVRLFDSSAKTQVELSGVSFILLRHGEAGVSALPKIVVSSNFTAEPVEDVLKFWGAHFNLETNIGFAPYDQIFQQLLQTESAFAKNSAGFNIILLQLEKWAVSKPHSVLEFDRAKAEQLFGKRKGGILPNGLEIVHLNEYETDYLYKEIFEDESYLKHGIHLHDGATVVDIGANIGMFSLFVMSRCRNPKIYAFEPAPVAYDLLKANCEVYSSDAQVFNFGVSDRCGTATFTFYENSSVFSGFHSDQTEDGEAIQAVVRNMLEAESLAGESTQQYVNELTMDRLRHSTYECRLTTVSEIIREHQIDRIDLLKIDAEKSELEIIRGIADADWPKIQQIVIEIHDPIGEVVRQIKDLLMQKGFRCAIEQEKLLQRSGLFNLFAIRDAAVVAGAPGSARMQNAAAPQKIAQPHGSLQRNIRDFSVALESFASRAQGPVVVCCCPASPAVEDDVNLKAAVPQAERELLARVGTLAGVATISSDDLLRRYPVDGYYDVHGHQLGDIPYTPEGYVAIGTALFRAMFNLKRKPFKVIVLDCDNTLWQGVCGEDGSRGVAVTEPYRALQQFMVDQAKAGMLLCLCSKNNEQDVLEVFDQRDDMLLKREHLASWRINWRSKPENIKSLANELNLALDSFIFIDDNPVDCAEVEINCPAVLTLKLPENPMSFSSFFEHIWAFDHAGITDEDRVRVRMYQDTARRENFRTQAPSLRDFIDGLQIRVDIGDASEDQFSRISQLTLRTNQFNFTTVRRSPSQIADFLRRENSGCLTVRVEDRFGDYGLVGVVLYETEGDRLKLDTFLLSCRVLGRGVEHRVLSSVGQRALVSGKRFVEVTCSPTERNLLAREFVSSLGDQYRTNAGDWLFPAEYLAGLQYNLDHKTQQPNDEPETLNPQKLQIPSASGFNLAARSEHLQRIGEQLYDVRRVATEIDKFRLETHGLEGVSEKEPAGKMQAAVANIWKKVLGRPDVGLNVNFFEAGGTSLRAVQVVAMIRKELKQNLLIVTLFECPTVRLLAAKLSAAADSPTGEPNTAAVLRGQQRRSRAMRRKKNQ